MTEFDPTPNALSLAFAEQLYADYLRDPAAVPADWRAYFAATADDAGAVRLGPSFAPPRLFNPPAPNGHVTVKGAADIAARQDKVDQLIRAYRVRGHLAAQLDPLSRPRPRVPELELGFYGLSDADLDQTFSTDAVGGPKVQTLRAIIERLRTTYTRSIGVQFMHIDDLDVKNWLQERMERSENRLSLSRDEQLRIFTRLTDAVMFEEFIQKKYLGAKSFSLEGAESLIPLLDLAIEKAGDLGVQEIVLGMAHRGRLNVLANIIGKSPRAIFREFDDRDPELYLGSGDVKYHLGHSHDWTTSTGKQVHLTLTFNPSHLEYVNTVVQGRTRAKQDRFGDHDHSRGMAVLIHGDAAFAGEGIVQETLNLSELPGYAIGGTLHIVVNNQIGFTTPPEQGRSSVYATDVAKMLQIPIFHVNGEDPEAVAQVVRLALDFRQTFKRDVVIDLYAFRRLGHNESDEPQFTQPLMYKAIARRESVDESYLRHLLTLGGVTREEAERVESARREHLEGELSAARQEDYKAQPAWLGGVWQGYGGGAEPADDPMTGVGLEAATSLLAGQTMLPQGFHPHKKIERLLDIRRQMASGEKSLDWSAGEALAFGSLVTAGTRIRMTGQDVQRGTFSHRHAVLHDVTSGQTHMPLAHLAPDQAPIEISNSPLSESGVLGFEYGYSLDSPGALVLWEAQFGDFVNVAQPIVDQFIASAEDKWKRLSGLVMLLPHGMEGQGPEHSSARLERFLALAARDNIQVIQPSTPAQYFHMLRRQVLRPWRKPLVVMTPKSLLRHPACVSPLAEFGTGTVFQRVMMDTTVAPEGVQRVLLCSGKIYFELDRRRQETGRTDVAIVRIEQLYPLPIEALKRALAPYAEGTPVFWVQDEPENMGAWRYLYCRFGATLFGRHPFAGYTRPEAASPASGSASAHRLEEERLMTQAFDTAKKEIASHGR